MLPVVPTLVIEPITVNVAPSPAANPSPDTITFLFVNAVPSYGFLEESLVNVTFLLEI